MCLCSLCEIQWSLVFTSLLSILSSPFSSSLTELSWVCQTRTCFQRQTAQKVSSEEWPRPPPRQGTNLIVALFVCPECLLVKTGSLRTFILFPFFMTHKVLGGDHFHWCPSPAPLWVCDAGPLSPPCACSFHCFAVTNNAVINTSCLCILCCQRHVFRVNS